MKMNKFDKVMYITIDFKVITFPKNKYVNEND